MGLFDIFSSKPAEQAARDQEMGLRKGYTLAGDLYNTGNKAINAGYGQAGDLYSGLAQSTGRGAEAYGDASGANGAEGLARAKALFTASPGYQSGFDLLTEGNDRRAASRGALGSGNTIADTAKLATTYSDQNYGNYASRLQPYLGANAGAVAGQAGASTGQANAINSNMTDQAKLGFGVESGIGNANANADLAKYGASQNIWNMITKLGGLGANLAGGFGSPAGGPVGFAPNPNGGGISPMFGGGPNQSGGSSGFDLSKLLSMFR